MLSQLRRKRAKLSCLFKLVFLWRSLKTKRRYQQTKTDPHTDIGHHNSSFQELVACIWSWLNHETLRKTRRFGFGSKLKSCGYAGFSLRSLRIHLPRCHFGTIPSPFTSKAPAVGLWYSYAGSMNSKTDTGPTFLTKISNFVLKNDTQMVKPGT